MKDGDDLAGDGALDVDFDFRLHVADFSDLDLHVGGLGLADLDRQLRFLLVARLRLHGHKHAGHGENEDHDRDGCESASALRWTHACSPSVSSAYNG
jgi:hypothetical protein